MFLADLSRCVLFAPLDAEAAYHSQDCHMMRFPLTTVRLVAPCLPPSFLGVLLSVLLSKRYYYRLLYRCLLLVGTCVVL